jgi:hypothetical protein
MKKQKIVQYTGQDVAKFLKVEDKFKKVINESEIRELDIQQKLDAARKNFFSSKPKIFNENEFDV